MCHSSFFPHSWAHDKDIASSKETETAKAKGKAGTIAPIIK